MNKNKRLHERLIASGKQLKSDRQIFKNIFSSSGLNLRDLENLIKSCNKHLRNIENVISIECRSISSRLLLEEYGELEKTLESLNFIKNDFFTRSK